MSVRDLNEHAVWIYKRTRVLIIQSVAIECMILSRAFERVRQVSHTLEINF